MMTEKERRELANLRKRVEYQRGEIKRLGGQLGPLLWACPVCKSYTRSPLAGGWNYCPTCGHVKRPLEERRTNGQEV